MSENEPPEVPATALGPSRPLSIKITDGLRAPLDVIAQLNDRSVTEEIRLALEAWVETSKSDPEVLQRAETARAEIEREAQTKQSALEAIFGASAPTGAKAPAPRGKPAQAQVAGVPRFERLPPQPGGRRGGRLGDRVF